MPDRDALMAKDVAVLLGGKSAEREISLKTGEAVALALKARGYRVVELDPAADDFVARLSKERPVAVFNALHGRYGEDGCIQGLLESLAIPYTGSGVLASAVAMDKVATKHLFKAMGMPTPDYLVFSGAEATTLVADGIPFGLPVAVKPAREGSSVGIAMVHEPDDLLPALKTAAGFDGPVLVERYVKGKEISVAVLDGEPLGAIEIVPARPFYDFEAKYGANSGTRYLHPPSVSAQAVEQSATLAARAYAALGCSGVIRVDFMVDEDDAPWLIEVNTLPGMTETSLVPKIAAGAGIDFEGLCERLLEGAATKG
jgi:D-alanine-D-alanine ligase